MYSEHNLKWAMDLLPDAVKGEFALRLIGASSNGSIKEDEQSETWSTSINPEQARQLIQKVDKATVEMIRQALMNEADGIAVIDWSVAKEITGVKNWAQFARGRLGGLHRSLSAILGQPKSTLIWEGDGWVEDGKGDYSSGTLVIDGPAVRSLKVALGIQE
jgi:hypothetical protein